ncbi:MAG: hypothetical protein QOI03_2171 [Solirubrobacteraceae bacterium]|nr:hypothetical protein [Solirubrobacteraceae bacterium]
MPSDRRKSNPVNGSVAAFEALVGLEPLLGSVPVAGVLSFDGEVPVLGVEVVGVLVLVGVVGVGVVVGVVFGVVAGVVGVWL